MLNLDSAIQIEPQTASATVHVPGTDLSLNYRSDRQPGRRTDREIRIPLTGPSPLDSLNRVKVTVDVAGQHHELEFGPEANQVHQFVWDGTDAYGNRVEGSQVAEVEISYVYDGTYRPPEGDSTVVRSFGRQNPDTSAQLIRSREEVELSAAWEVELMRFEPTEVGPGWTVGPHHRIDVHNSSNRLTLWRGDGSVRSMPGIRSHRVDRTRPNRTASALDDSTRFRSHAISVTPDGTVLVASSTDVGTGDVLHELPRGDFAEVMGTGGRSFEEVATRVAGFASRSVFRDDVEDDLEAERAPLGYLRDVAADSRGNRYVVEEAVDVVRRVTPDGTLEFFAGTATPATGAGADGVYDSFEEWRDATDGEPATEIPIQAPQSIAVSPDGNVYLGMRVGTEDVISRVSPDGRIHHELGPFSPDEQYVGGPMACDQDGNLLIGTPGNVFRVDAQNSLTVVAGNGTDDLLNEWYRPADVPDHLVSVSDAEVGTVVGLDVGPNGRVFVADRQADTATDGTLDRSTIETTIRAFRPGGDIVRVAGYGDDSVVADGPVRNAFSNTVDFPNPVDVALTPGAELFFAGPREYLTHAGFVFGRIRMSTDLDTVYFASQDGAALHEFTDGRHTATYDALTGATRYSFEYDADGRLVGVTDVDGATVRIERDADGAPTALVAPDGQRTELSTNDDGYLGEVTTPDGRTASFDYADGGLLESITQPSGDSIDFEYSALGRLVARTRATGGRDELVREETTDGYEVRHVTPELRETTIETDTVPEGRRITTACCGGATRETLITPDGEYRTRLEDGARRTTMTSPDPRFGDQAAYPSMSTYLTPGGTAYTTEMTRSVTLTDPSDLLSVESLTETSTVTGRSYERSYTGDANRVSLTSPAGRTVDVGLDAGRLSAIAPDGADSVILTRDADGRVTALDRTGTRVTLAYDDSGYPAAVSDAEGRRSEMAFDDAGLPVSFSTPAGNTTTFVADDNGYLSEMTRPGGDVHDYTFDASGELASYSPPGGGTLELTHDDDGLPTALTLPSGRTVENVFDTAGRLQRSSHPDATVTYDRDDADRLTELAWSPADGGPGQTISMTRDGENLSELSYAGAASGTFAYGHDDDGRVTELTYPDGTTRLLSHDDDGLLTGWGLFTVERDGPMGKPSRITDGVLSVTFSYDSHGRVATRTHDVDGTTLYDVSYTYDASGLLVERTETIGNETRTESFTYDADGRLTGVERDGATVESYDYDADGNRVSRTVDGTTESATYAAGDRLIEHGGTSFSYDADGFVTARGGDALTYSATGDLLDATSADGNRVTYTYDGYGRRTARTEGGDTTEYLYGDPNNPTQVTVARDASGTRTQYLYDPFGRAFAFERDGDWYYVATDQVGTPRAVAAADGTIVKEIDRDAFGVVRSDSAPGFELHIGFAGGIPDPVTGLVRFGQRDYDPSAGRWFARDPLLLLGDQFNFYAYVDNDPVNGVDPTGLSWECWAAKTGENFGKMLERTDLIGKLLDAAGVDTGSTDYESLFKEGVKEFGKQMAKGAGRKAAAKAAAKQMLKSATRGGYYQLALYGGLLVGSGIYAGIKEYFGQGPGEALFELIHGPNRSIKLCEAVKRGLVDHPCPEKLPMECC